MEPVYGYEYQPAAHLLVTDEDAADFLQSQFTNDLRPFEAERSSYGLWLDVKGKVVADSYVLCEGEERFRIFSEASAAEALADKLQRHIIADEVEIEVMPAGYAIALIGAGAVALLEALGVAVPEVGRFIQSQGLCVWRGRRSHELSFELWVETPAAASQLKLRLLERSVHFVATARVQAIRVAAGIPSVPQEIGPTDLPGEGGLVGDAVALNKGCYLGQEVVSRMHHVGSPQRGLFRICGAGAVPVCPVALYQGAKQVGELRTAFADSAGWRGVALLKTRFAAEGMQLSCGEGSAAVESRFTAVAEGTE
jgi:folate-binding protein YgfZ